MCLCTTVPSVRFPGLLEQEGRVDKGDMIMTDFRLILLNYVGLLIQEQKNLILVISYCASVSTLYVLNI